MKFSTIAAVVISFGSLGSATVPHNGTKLDRPVWHNGTKSNPSKLNHTIPHHNATLNGTHHHQVGDNSTHNIWSGGHKWNDTHVVVGNAMMIKRTTSHQSNHTKTEKPKVEHPKTNHTKIEHPKKANHTKIEHPKKTNHTSPHISSGGQKWNDTKLHAMMMKRTTSHKSNSTKTEKPKVVEHPNTNHTKTETPKKTNHTSPHTWSGGQKFAKIHEMMMKRASPQKSNNTKTAQPKMAAPKNNGTPSNIWTGGQKSGATKTQPKVEAPKKNNGTIPNIWTGGQKSAGATKTQPKVQAPPKNNGTIPQIWTGGQKWTGTKTQPQKSKNSS